MIIFNRIDKSMKRKPTKEELELIIYLVLESNYNISHELINSIMVSPMNDSGMGSLLIFTENFNNNERFYGDTIGEYNFKDEDGVSVSITLNVDADDDLFELDIWKVDFSKLLKLPSLPK